jgi:hypothetical protein
VRGGRPSATARENRLRTSACVLVSVLVVVACGRKAPPPAAPAPPAEPADPAAVRAVAEACARLTACIPTRDEARLHDASACVDWWFENAAPASPDPLKTCLQAARSCGDVHTCMQGGGHARAAAFCQARQGVVSGCDGNHLVSCGDEAAVGTTVVDCAALGGACRESKTPGGLVLRSCVAPDLCPADAPESRCEGIAAIVSCRDGAIERVVCPPGTRCEERGNEHGESNAACLLPGGRRCGLLASRLCEDDRLIACEGGDRVTVSDCAAFGLRCAGLGPRAGCYVADRECDREMLPTCEKGALVFCAAGRTTKIPCSAVGLGPCRAPSRGARAACSTDPGPTDAAEAAGPAGAPN